MRNRSLARFCRGCDRARDEAGGERFSARGLCRACSHARMVENMDGGGRGFDIGAWWDAWRRGMAGAIGIALDEGGKDDAGSDERAT